MYHLFFKIAMLQNDVHYQGVYGDNMCLNLYCHNSNTGQCEAVPADDGVPCGDGKV